MQWNPQRALTALVLTSSVALAVQNPPQQPNVSPSMSTAEFADAVGGTLSTAAGATLVLRHRKMPNANNPTATVWALRLTNTSTGWDEDFLLGNPVNPGGSPAPLLVLWHQWSTSEDDTWVNTSFFEEATQRGWYVIAPLGAHQHHLGIDYAQRNTEELIEFMAAWLPRLNGNRSIDKTRVYGVGFSMGGGALTSYACRHLDPTEYPYAAILNYTGTMSVARGWRRLPPNINNPSDQNFEFRNHPRMFGGNPYDNAFAYQIASCIHLWPKPAEVDPTSDLLRNIPALNAATVFVSTDDHPNVDQCRIATTHAASLGFPLFIGASIDPDPTVPPCSQQHPDHCWGHLNESYICWWLDSKFFKKPTGHTRILADRDARYYDISVTQTNQGVLSPFEYDVTNVSGNNLWLRTSRETSAFQIHTLAMELDPTNATATLTLNLQGPPGLPAPVTLKVDGYTTPQPGTATRTPPHAGSTAQWNPAGTIMTIGEPDPGSNPVWTIP